MKTRKSKLNVSAPTSGKAYYDFKRNTYRRGCEIGEQPYYWFQGIGDITGHVKDVLATVAYEFEYWHGMDLFQGDLGIVDKDNDFTVDSQGFLICTRPDANRFSIDQSTAELVHSS